MQTQPATDRPARQRHAPATALALVIYLLLSLFFFGKAVNWTSWLRGYGTDPQTFVWFINWWPFALTHHLNPFISQYVWYPLWDNFTWHTAVPTAALLSLPITLLGGPVLAFNVLTVMAPALSAWTAFLLARYLTGNWAASLLGGYLFGFSSYEFGEMLGHLNIDLTFLIPLAVLLCVRRARGELGRTAFILALALVLLAELGLSTEILASFTVLGGITWAIFLACAPATDRPHLWRLAIDYVLANLVMTVLAAPFLFFLIKGLADLPVEINSVLGFSADPLNYFIPTLVTQFQRSTFTEVAALFTGNGSEQGAYLGWPLILLLVFYFRDQIALPYAKALLIAGLLIAVMAMGPRLHIAGAETRIDLPWWLFIRVPLIKSALPTRFTMYVSLVAAIAAALYLAAPAAGFQRFGRFVLGVLACLVLIPNTHLHVWQPWPAQPFFTPQNVSRALGPKANVLILPFNQYGPGSAWQLDAGMQFTQSGGYTGFFPKAEQNFPVVPELLNGIPSAGFANDLSAFCALHHVDDILIGPGTPPPLITAINALDWPQHTDHGIVVVQVPPPSKLNYLYVDGEYWPGDSPESWMGGQLRIVTHGHPAVLTLLGKWRPTTLPLTVTLTTPSAKTVYPINPKTVQVIPLPANTDLTLTASGTFVPDEFLHNADMRHLSVLISLENAHS
jgi:hypothetical protein